MPQMMHSRSVTVDKTDQTVLTKASDLQIHHKLPLENGPNFIFSSGEMEFTLLASGDDL